MTEKAQHKGEHVTGQSSSSENVGEALKEQGQRATEEIKREGTKIIAETKSRAEQLAIERRDDTANYLKVLSSAVERGAEELERSGYGHSASMFTRAAEECDHLAARVGDRDPKSLVQDLQDYARGHPALFFGAALVLGIGASRFLTSTSDREPDGSPSAMGDAS